jgi:hypothetical protein
VRAIAVGARNIRRNPNAVPTALGSFVDSLDVVGGDTAAGDGMLREIASQVLGADMARRAFDGVAPPPQADEVLGPVALADPEALAMVLSREQPQTVALVLGAMDPARAGLVPSRPPRDPPPSPSLSLPSECEAHAVGVYVSTRADNAVEVDVDRPGVPVLLVMVFSAFSGSAAVVNGVLLFLGQIKLEGLQEGIFGALFTNGILGTVIWLVLGAAALYWQMRDVGQTITSIDRTRYQY